MLSQCGLDSGEEEEACLPLTPVTPVWQSEHPQELSFVSSGSEVVVVVVFVFGHHSSHCIAQAGFELFTLLSQPHSPRPELQA